MSSPYCFGTLALDSVWPGFLACFNETKTITQSGEIEDPMPVASA
jgi:hypothetical protein